MDIKKTAIKLIELFEQLPECHLNRHPAFNKKNGNSEELELQKEIQTLTVQLAKAGLIKDVLCLGVSEAAAEKRYEIADNGMLVNQWTYRRKNFDITTGENSDNPPSLKHFRGCQDWEETFARLNANEISKQGSIISSLVGKIKHNSEIISDDSTPIRIFHLGARADLSVEFYKAVQNTYPERKIIYSGINHKGSAVNKAYEELVQYGVPSSHVMIGNGFLQEDETGKLRMNVDGELIQVEKSDIVIASNYCVQEVMNEGYPNILENLSHPGGYFITISNEGDLVTDIKDSSEFGSEFRPSGPKGMGMNNIEQWFDNEYEVNQFISGTTIEFPAKSEFFEFMINIPQGKFDINVPKEYKDLYDIMCFFSHVPPGAMSETTKRSYFNEIKTRLAASNNKINCKLGFSIVASKYASKGIKRAINEATSEVAKEFAIPAFNM